MIRKCPNPQSFDVEETLTATGVRNHSGCFRRQCTGEGTILTQEAGVEELGLLVNRQPMVVGVYWLSVAVDLGSV